VKANLHSFVEGGCDVRLANCPKWYLIPPQDINMRIPDNLKKCVTFVGIKDPKENIEQIRYIGTAFIVSLPSSKVPNSSFIYIVTAKHVARKIENKECYLRANMKFGDSAIFALENVSWFFHPSENSPTDVAVYPFALEKDELKKIDFEAIPTVSFLSDETRINQGIGEGDEVFMVGLFSRHTGNQKNLPIIRMGTIAMISDEPIQTQKFGSIEAYLIEARSIKGLSGSPVFVLKQNGIQIGQHIVPSSKVTLHFLGLMHGHWDLKPGESVDVDDVEGGEDSVNVGIAIVIPAKHILETINCDGLVKFRESQEANWIARNSPTPD
jgi:hypothetical protein